MGFTVAVNWAAYDMATKFAWVNGKPGMQAVVPVTDGLAEFAGSLDRSREACTRQLGNVQVDWRGAASDAAQRSLGDTARVAGDTVTTTQDTSDRLTDYGHSFEAMRRQISYVDPAQYSAWQRGVDRLSEAWSGLTGDSADHVTIAERNQANDEVANRALQNHTVEATAIGDRLPATAPPSPPAGTPPAAGGGGAAGVGGGTPIGPIPDAAPPVAAAGASAHPSAAGPGPGPTAPAGPAGPNPSPGAPAPSETRPGPFPVTGPGGAGTPPGGTGGGRAGSVGARPGAPTGSAGNSGGAGGTTGRTPGDHSAGSAPGIAHRPGTDPTSPGSRFGQAVGNNALVRPGPAPRVPSAGPYGSASGRYDVRPLPGSPGSGEPGTGTRARPGGFGTEPYPATGRGAGAWGGGAGDAASRGTAGWGTEARGTGARATGPAESWSAGARSAAERGGVPAGYGPMAGGVAGASADQEHRNRYVVPTDEVFDIPITATDAVLGPDGDEPR